jgi:transposase InsO family protein
LLKREVFTGLVEAKVLVEEYREHHNHRQPHSSLGFLIPVEFAARDEPSGADEGLIKELELVMALL